MPGNFEHIDVGPTLSRVEWQLATAHHLESQAVGDIIYASSAAQLEGLGIGPNGDLLIVSGGIPSWAHILQVETNGLTIGLVAGAPEPDNDAVHIWRGDAGVVTATADAALIVEGSGNTSISILAPNSNSKGIDFGEPGSNIRGRIIYEGSTDAAPDTFRIFTANNIERLRISAAAFAFQEATSINTTVGDLIHAPANNVVLAPVNNEVVPDADDDVTLGTAGLRWSDLRSVLINGADYGLTLNRWRMLESELYHGYPEGWALAHGHFVEGKMGPQKAGARPTFVITDDFIEYQGRRITPAILDRVLELVA